MSLVRRLRPDLAFAVLAVGFLSGDVFVHIFSRISERVVDSGFDDTDAGDLLLALAFTLVGIVIALRRPMHPVGIALLVAAFGISGYMSMMAWAEVGLASPDGGLPGGSIAATISSAIWPAIIAGMFFLALLFPNGRLEGRIWRKVVWVWGAAAVVLSLSYVFLPLDLEPPFDDRRSPLSSNELDVLLPLVTVCTAIVLPIAGAGVINLLFRFWRSSGVEREQFRWLALTAALTLTAMLLIPLDDVTYGLGTTLQGLAFLGFPVAVGVAVLRYRLYDIDRLINRTLVYGLLTAMLAAVYFGLVVGLQELLTPLSGGSDLAIALTTLAVAALFLPARSRIQAIVDRRFNRRAYDAARTVEVFSARLREEIDLDTLRYEVLAVLDETMQPAGASLWLKDAHKA